MNKPYQAPILNEFYYCRKGFKNPVFKRANIQSQTIIAGRIGTSCCDISGKIYIFGGFYERQKNYLDLQHDIVTVDIQFF